MLISHNATPSHLFLDSLDELYILESVTGAFCLGPNVQGSIFSYSGYFGFVSGRRVLHLYPQLCLSLKVNKLNSRVLSFTVLSRNT